jgi:hypothetical protein
MEYNCSVSVYSYQSITSADRFRICSSEFVIGGPPQTTIGTRKHIRPGSWPCIDMFPRAIVGHFIRRGNDDTSCARRVIFIGLMRSRSKEATAINKTIVCVTQLPTALIRSQSTLYRDRRTAGRSQVQQKVIWADTWAVRNTCGGKRQRVPRRRTSDNRALDPFVLERA